MPTQVHFFFLISFFFDSNPMQMLHNKTCLQDNAQLPKIPKDFFFEMHPDHVPENLMRNCGKFRYQDEN